MKPWASDPDARPRDRVARWNGANRWPLVVGLVTAALTTAPYAWAAAHADAHWAFTGFLFGVEDGLSYIAKMRLGAQGAWLFRTPYTTRPAMGLPVYSAYLALGHLLGPRAPYTAFVLLFHAFRLAALAGLVFALQRVLAWLLPGRPKAQAAAALWALLGGGLGWTLFLFGQGQRLGWGGPLSFYAPEAFGFLAVWGLPHLSAGRAAWLYAWWALAHRRYRAFILAAWALLLFQPLFIVPLTLLSLGTLVFQGRTPHTRAQILALAVAALGWALVWGPLLYARLTDPVVQAWDAQNNVRLVPALALVLAYGPWLPWVVPGWRALHRERPAVARALLAWMGLSAGLMLLPTSVQRRLLEGVWVAWGALAVRGASRRGRWRHLPLLTTAVAPALLLSLAWQAGTHPGPPLFRPRAEAAAMQAWSAQVPLAAGVLAAYPSSTALPAWAPVRAPAGHPVESPQWAEHRAQARAFFAATTSDAQRRAMLRAWQVDWVWWGPRERALGPWDPRTAAYLEPVFRHGAFWALRVRP